MNRGAPPPPLICTVLLLGCAEMRKEGVCRADVRDQRRLLTQPRGQRTLDRGAPLPPLASLPAVGLRHLPLAGPC